MISYGSQQDSTPMSPCDRSHQLGEGHSSRAEMPRVRRPSRLVYGRNTSRSQQRQTAIDTFHQLGKGQGEYTGMSVVVHPSHQLGEGHQCGAEMPTWTHPPRLVFGSLCYHAAMPIYDRSHLFTRGQSRYAAMPLCDRLSREGSASQRRNVKRGPPFPPVLGHLNHAAMLISKRPISTRGHTNGAAMPLTIRLATKEIQYG